MNLKCLIHIFSMRNVIPLRFFSLRNHELLTIECFLKLLWDKIVLISSKYKMSNLYNFLHRTIYVNSLKKLNKSNFQKQSSYVCWKCLQIKIISRFFLTPSKKNLRQSNIKCQIYFFCIYTAEFRNIWSAIYPNILSLH